MPSLRTWLVLAVLACGSVPVGAGEPPPPVFDYDAAERGLAAGALPEGGARALLERASAALSRRKELADDAAARGSVSYAATAQAKVQNWLGIEASAGFGHAGGTVAVGHRLLKFKGSADPNDRSVTSQIEVAYGRDADGALLKHAWSVKLEYDDNRTYLRALGVDARNFPGMRMVIELMDRVTGREAEAVREQAPGAGVQAALEAAGAELRKLVPDMFQAATEFRRFTIGEGTIVESPGGEVSVSHMRQELLERGQQVGEGRRWSEVAVGADLDAELAAGRAGRVGAGLSLELKRTYGDAPAVDRDANASAARLFAQGDLTGVAQRLEERLAPVLEPERQQRALDALEQRGEAVPAGTDRILAVADRDVGGVRLQYDPAMLASAVAPARAARLLARALERLEAGEQGFVVHPDDGRVALVAVSLDALLRSGARTVASITRLRGGIVAGDDVLLLGEAEEGVPALETDTLAVAARNVWQEGTFPFVSLDPDPADLRGPQQVRLGGLLASTQRTRFVRILLDADYAMKRISLGAERLEVPGFRSLLDLLREGPVGREVLARAWLSPMRSSVADVWTFAEGGRQAYLFDTRVQVLSESMRRTREGLMGGGEVDPVSAAAADAFTCHYDALAAQRPVLGELRGLFSAVKLCAILRSRGARPAALGRLAARPSAEVEVPTSYPGVHVEQGTLQLSGGALCRVHLARSAFRASPELAALMSAQPGGTVDASFPTTVGLSAEEAFEASGEVHANRGLAAFQEGDYAGCERHMDQALQRDADLVPARLLRAVCRAARGDMEGARSDVDAAEPVVPQIVGLRALLHVLAGRRDEAQRDLERAGREFPHDDDVLSWRAQAHLYLGETAQAEALALVLLRRTPTDPSALGLWDTLALLHRMGPERGRERLELMRRVPLMVTEALADGTQALQRLDVAAARERLEACLALLDARPDDPAALALHLRARCELMLVLAHRFAERLDQAAASVAPPVLAPADPGQEPPAPPDAHAIVERLLARHPDWPSVHMLAAMTQPDAEADLLRSRLDAALRLPREGDPLLADLAVQLGTQRMDAWVAFTLYYQATQKKQPASVLEPLLDRLVAALGSSPEAELVRLLREGDSIGVASTAVRLRERLLALPTPLASEPVTTMVVGFCFAVYLGVSERVERERERRPDVARWFLQASDVADLPGPAWTQLSLYRMAALGTLAEVLGAERAADPELRRLRLAVANRRAPLPELRARIEGWKAAHALKARERLGPFLAEWVSVMRRDGAEDDLHASAAALLEEVPEGEERAAYARELESWRAALAAERGLAALADPGRAAPPTPEEVAGARATMLARLDRVHAMARRPADLHMLASLANLLSTALPTLATRDPVGAAAMRSVLERMASGLSGEGLRLAARDWSAWAQSR